MIILTQDSSCCLFAFSVILLSTAVLATTQTPSSSGDQIGLFPGSAEPEPIPEPEINPSLLDGSRSQESALLFNGGGDDGETNVIPPLDIPIPDIFPNGFPKFFDPEGLLRWLNKPKKSDCDNGKSLFCCQLGPPRPLLDLNTPYESPERLAERQTRMRECVPCKESPRPSPVLHNYWSSFPRNYSETQQGARKNQHATFLRTWVAVIVDRSRYVCIVLMYILCCS